MGAMTLDTIMIKIDSNANKATGNIDKLSASLNNLKSAIKGGFNNLSKLSESLDKLSKASNKIPKLKENLDGISEIASSLNKLSEIGNPKGLQKTVDNLSKLPSVMAKITPKHLENVTRVSNQLASALTPLADKLGQIGEGLSSLSQLADKYGVSVTKVHDYTKQTRSQFTKMGSALSLVGKAFKGVSGVSQSFGKTAVKQFTKLHSKIKQIGLSLLGTRTLFTAVRKAVSEYMALDQELANNIQNVWRALGAQLAPVIEYVIYLFKQFVRVVYSFVKAITGIDLIARANAKAMAGWGKSAKDTLGQLQKFDDLNVAEFDKGSGDNAFIDLTEIDLSPIQWIIDATLKIKQALKEAFDTGEWYGVGGALGDGINAGLDKVNTNVLRDKLFNITEQFGQTMNGVIDTLNWGNLASKFSEVIKTIHDSITNVFTTINWESLGEGLNDFVTNLDVSGVLVSFVKIYTSIANGLKTMLSEIDWSIVGQKISETLVGITSLLANELSNTDFTALGTAIREVITNIDWKTIWDNVVTIAKESLGGLSDFIDGLFGTEGIGKLALSITSIVVALDGIKKLSSVFTPLVDGALKVKDAIGGVPKIFETISLLSKNTLSAESISGITGLSGGLTKALTPIANLVAKIGGGAGGAAGLGSLIPIVAAVVVGIMALVTAFKNLYEKSEPFRQTVDGLIASIKDTLLVVLDNLKTMLSSLWDVLVTLWEEAIKPLFDLLVSIVEPILEALINILDVLWKNAIKPLVEGLMKILAPAFEFVMDIVKALIVVIGAVIDIIQWLWTYLLEPIVSFLLDIVVGAIKLIGVVVESAIDFIVGCYEKFINNMRLGWEMLKGGFLAVYNYVKEKFIDPLTKAWEKIKNGWDKMWDGIKSGAKSAVNWILEKVESFINRMIDGINGLSSGLRKIGNKIFDIIGVDVSFEPIGRVSLPRLETGTNNVPYEGIYHLHPGEAVVPKKYNPALGNGGSEETNQKLDTLISLMESMNFTNIVNVGNATLYKEQQAYNKMQNDKYGTTVSL